MENKPTSYRLPEKVKHLVVILSEKLLISKTAVITLAILDFAEKEKATKIAQKISAETITQMANRFAENKEGYTEEEWDKMPYSYIGDCFKQCYEPRLMIKGDVLEYGVRGVYVCSGCQYAYPPMAKPEETNLEEYNREISELGEEIDRNIN